MADLKKTVEIIFQGQDDVSDDVQNIKKVIDSLDDDISIGLDIDDDGGLSGLTPKISAIKVAFNEAGISSKDFSNALNNISSITGGLATSFTTLIGGIALTEAAFAGLVVGGIGYVINEAGVFSAAMSDIYSLLDISPEKFDKYKKAVLDYSTTSTQSLDVIQLALYNAISSGVDYTNSLDFIAKAEKLAVGGKTDLNSAVQLLSGTLNAYEAATSEASDYSDIFFKIVKNGVTTIPELATSLADVTSIAAAGGIPFETLGAAIAALTATGTPTAQAITKIKAAIEGIINPTDGAKAAAAALGIEFSGAALESKGFEGILNEIKVATGGNIDTMTKLFTSTEALGAVLSLTGGGAKTFNDTLDEMSNRAGATEAAFNKMKDNLNLVFQTLINNFKSIFIGIGLELEDEGIAIIKAFTNLFENLGDAVKSEEFKAGIDFIEAKLQGLADTINKIAPNIGEALTGVDLKPLLEAVDEVITALGFKNIDFTSVEGLTKVFQTVIDAMTSFQKIVVEIIDIVKEVGSAFDNLSSDDVSYFINSATDAVIKLIENWKIFLTLGIVSFFTSTASTILAFLTSITTLSLNLASLGSVGTRLGTTFGLLAGAFGPVTLAIGVAATAFWALYDSINNADGIVNTFLGEIQSGFETVFGKIDGILTSFFSADAWSKLWDSFKLGADDTTKSVDTTAESIKELENALTYLPEFKEVEIEAQTDAEKLYELEQALTYLPTNIETEISVNTDKAQEETKKLTETLTYWVEGEKFEIEVPVTADTSEAMKKIDEVTTPKMLEIQLQGDIDKELALIETTAKTAQEAFKYKAEVDIAQIEAAAKRVESTFDSINTTIGSTGDLISSALDSLSGDTFEERWAARDVLREEQEAREKALKLQEEMIRSEIRLNEERAKALQNGDALITISSDGLEPALELVMWQILEKIQVRASESGSEFLLGI